MASEVLAQKRVYEAGQRISAWLHEIWHGAPDARSLQNQPPPDGLGPILVTDAYDVFLSLKCTRPYQGTDLSLVTYLEALREDLTTGRIAKVAWVSTGQMLVDSLTKNMKDVLIQRLMQTGIWEVTEKVEIFDGIKKTPCPLSANFCQDALCENCSELCPCCSANVEGSENFFHKCGRGYCILTWFQHMTL